MKIKFSESKSAKLVAQRGISLDFASRLISSGNFLEIADHPNIAKYPNQRIIYLPIGEEIYVAPCVVEDDGSYFLKTIFPSRKARKKFLGNKKPRQS